MRLRKIKDRCTKKSVSKCDEVVKTYDKVQLAYLDILEKGDDIVSFECNVPLKGLSEGDFTSDFLCKKINGDYCVRECTYRSKLSLPRTAKLLDASRNYWMRRGITDWAVVIEKEGCDGSKK